ncbi:hypothetical protein ACTL6U_06510 [Rhodovibrionaceae bacterium A322]
MSKVQINRERLNAYVDGELSASEAAEVAALIAADKRAAQIVAELSAMKSGLKAAFPTDGVSSEPLKATPKVRTKIAAAAAVVLIASAALISGLSLTDSSSQSDLITAALQNHDRQPQPAQAPSNGLASFQLTSLPSALVIPDLTTAGLTLSSFDPKVQLGTTIAAQITYLGSRGCRLSLFAFPRESGAQAIKADLTSSTLVERWNAGALDYLLVARQMDGTRFGVIAAALKEASSNGTNLEDQTRTALMDARQPCLA